MESRLLFAADIVPTESNKKYFMSGDIDYLFGKEIIEHLHSVQFRCFNLEVPLTREKIKVDYPGPHLIAEPETIKGIRKLDPSLLTLGNNHALDQGVNGLINTIQILAENAIPFVGVGANTQEASKPFFFEENLSRIGIYNCAEYECSAATNTHYGANHYDPLESFDHIQQMRAECDIIVVLYHGGKEFYRYPSPKLQKVCRKFVDSGANLVICQHSHCIGSYEKYNNSVIVYGPGNFLFDRNEDEYKKTGMFVECGVEAGRMTQVHFWPFIKTKECVRKANEEETERILADYYKRSEKINDASFLEEEYNRLAKLYYVKYVRTLSGNKRLFNGINKISNNTFYKNYYNRKKAQAILNIINTENHEELLSAALRLI